MEKPASTWSFDQGTLTVHHLGNTISLGRYATHDFAAKAAAVYFAKHGDRCCPPQSRRVAAKSRRSGRSRLREPSNAETVRDCAPNPEGSIPLGLYSCTSEKEAPGFAVRKLRCGHAVQEIVSVPRPSSSREQIPPPN